MTNPDSIERIVIVGGGTAGWMSAALLSRLTLNGSTTVTLVESDEIGIVGVGEATIPPIKIFNKAIGLSEHELLSTTNGTFKLGIEFVDWTRLGHRYFHPFSRYGVDYQALAFHQYWLKHRETAGDIADYNLCCIAAKANRFNQTSDPRASFEPQESAYHIDASLYAQTLRRHSIARGVKRIEGKVVEANLRPENGFIESLTMADGTRIAGDLFIDCSGFRSLLLGSTLDVEFEDWSHYLPCDRAVALPSERTDSLPAYTRSTALEAGWQWHIPLRHRTGNGYVYSSAHLSDDRATELLLSRLGTAPLADPRILTFKAGMRAQCWKNNCIALGLASGFLEPLESTSIHLVHSGLFKLMSLFPGKSCSADLALEYNRQMRLEFERIRDFLLIHYRVTERTDTPFWRDLKHHPLPDTLEHLLALFRGNGYFPQRDGDLFKEASWIAVLLGQNATPVRYDPLVDTVDDKAVGSLFTHLRSMLASSVASMPTHESYLKTNFPLR